MGSVKKSTTKLYNWAIQKASSKKAPLWLALLFALEIILFVPLDAILMFFCLQKRNNIFLYIMIATVASTVSGLAGYLLGHFLWDLIGGWVVPHLISASSFANLSGHFQHYENWAVFFGSLVPFPLKALSLVAGVFHLGIGAFVTCLAAARILRFALVGGAMALWERKGKNLSRPPLPPHFHGDWRQSRRRLPLLLGPRPLTDSFTTEIIHHRGEGCPRAPPKQYFLFLFTRFELVKKLGHPPILMKFFCNFFGSERGQLE